MEQIFTSGGGGVEANDMLGWASKLRVIGGVIEELGNKEDADGWMAEGLGMIIFDYAQALEATLTAFYPEIDNAIKDCEFPALVGIERDFKKIKSLHECPAKNDLIKENLEKIQEFKDKVSFVFDIEEKLKNLTDGNGKRHHTTILREDR